MQKLNSKFKTDLTQRTYSLSLTVYWFNLLKDAKLANESEVNILITETDEISRMLASSVMKLKNIKF